MNRLSHGSRRKSLRDLLHARAEFRRLSRRLKKDTHHDQEKLVTAMAYVYRLEGLLQQSAHLLAKHALIEETQDYAFDVYRVIQDVAVLFPQDDEES